MDFKNSITTKLKSKISAILIKDVKEAFISAFKTIPILVFSPGRINIIGEHTFQLGPHEFKIYGGSIFLGDFITIR